MTAGTLPHPAHDAYMHTHVHTHTHTHARMCACTHGCRALHAGMLHSNTGWSGMHWSSSNEIKSCTQTSARSSIVEPALCMRCAAARSPSAQQGLQLCPLRHIRGCSSVPFGTAGAAALSPSAQQGLQLCFLWSRSTADPPALSVAPPLLFAKSGSPMRVPLIFGANLRPLGYQHVNVGSLSCFLPIPTNQARRKVH